MSRTAAVLVTLWTAAGAAGPDHGAQRQTAAKVARSPAALAIASAASAPNLSDMVREALASDQPGMRLTAARIASIANLSHLVPDLARTLERETDARAAAVELKALLVFASPDAPEVLTANAYVRRAPAEPLAVYARWTAGVSPDQFAAGLGDWLAQAGPSAGWRFQSAFDEAVARKPELKSALSTTWMSRAPESWPIALGVLETTGHTAVVVAALTSEHEAVRRSTLWRVLGQRAWGLKLPPTVVAAGLPDTTPASNTPTWEHFGRELMARFEGHGATDRSSWLKTAAAGHVTDLRNVWWAERSLVPAERAAIRQILGADFPGDRPASAPADLRVRLRPPPPVMRTMPTVVPGLIPEIMKTTGCRLTARHRQVAVRVSYRPDGRPQSVFAAPGVSRECEAALRALTHVTIADEAYPVPGNTGEWLVLFVGRDYRQCIDGGPSSSQPAPASREELANLEPPMKTRHVAPIYPASARKAGMKGTASVEAVITTAGCLSDVTVLRSAGSTLDVAALETVTSWRYAPTFLDGKPVEILMSIDVAFGGK
jgi:TonB family protein